MTKTEIQNAKDTIYKMWEIEKAHTSTASMMIARYTKELEAKLNIQQCPSFTDLDSRIAEILMRIRREEDAAEQAGWKCTIQITESTTPYFSVGECMTEDDFHDQRLHTAIMEDEPWSITYDLIDRDCTRHQAAYHS